MTDNELLELLRDLESDRVERKESIADPRRIRQAVCAFANDLPNHGKPGVLFIGVRDDGSCANLPITDELLTTLSAMRDDGAILPLPELTVEKKLLDGCELAVVVVQPAAAPPVRYRGRTWIRVGPRRAVATPNEEGRLSEKRRSRDLTFDLQPVSQATLDDIDSQLFERTYLRASIAPEILEENDRSYVQQLTSLRMATADEPVRPTVLGLLVCGKEPTEFLPGAYVQFLRVDGADLSDPIQDAKRIDGPLPELLSLLDDTFHAHIYTAVDAVRASTELRSPDYPLEALQQLARNAVLHRTYEGSHAPVRISWFRDRVEIASPGGPYGQVNRENFGRPHLTDYRNPALAEAMRNLGYVQKFGIGIPLARRSLMENGNPSLEFEVEETSVLAVIRRRP